MMPLLSSARCGPLPRWRQRNKSAGASKLRILVVARRRPVSLPLFPWARYRSGCWCKHQR